MKKSISEMVSLNSVADCLRALDEKVLKDKLFPALEDETECGDALKVLEKISMTLFTDHTDGIEDSTALRKFKESDGYNFLLNCFNKYTIIGNKERVAIILGRFYYGVAVPPKANIIVKTLVDILKKDNNNDNIPIIKNALLSLITISIENRYLLYDYDIHTYLIPFIGKDIPELNDGWSVLLCNICGCFHEKRNEIIKLGIFDAIYKRLEQIFVFLPKTINPKDYELIKNLVGAIWNLLYSDAVTTKAFLATPLPSCLLKGLDTIVETAKKTDDFSELYEIEKYICRLFLSCSSENYKINKDLVDMGTAECMIRFVEEYVKMDGKRLDVDDVDNAIMTLHNITYFNSKTAKDKKFNDFKDDFEEIDATPRLYSFFEYFNKNVNSVNEKERSILDFTVITICNLFKSMRIPSIYYPVFEYLKSLKTRKGDIGRWAETTWDGLMDPDGCLSKE
jgi:hypothetical protein